MPMSNFEDQVKLAMDAIFDVYKEKEDVLLIREGEVAYPLRGIFSEVSQEVTNGGTVLTSLDPNITIWEKDLPQTLSKTLRFKARGFIFSIKDIFRDGHGNLTLYLYKES